MPCQVGSPAININAQTTEGKPNGDSRATRVNLSVISVNRTAKNSRHNNGKTKVKKGLLDRFAKGIACIHKQIRTVRRNLAQTTPNFEAKLREQFFANLLILFLLPE